MEAAVVAAGVQNAAAFDQHDFARFTGNYRNGKGGEIGAGEFLAKYLGGFNVRKNTAIAVIIDLHDLKRAGKQDADVARGRAFGKDGIFFIKADHLGVTAGKHFEKMLLVNALEEQTVL